MSRQAMVIEYKLFRYVFLLTKTMMHSQKHLKKRLYTAYIYIYIYIYMTLRKTSSLDFLRTIKIDKTFDKIYC
jgi:hypothetical protein